MLGAVQALVNAAKHAICLVLQLQQKHAWIFMSLMYGMPGSCTGSNNLPLPDSELHCNCRKLSLWVTVCWLHSKTRHPVYRLLVHVPLLLKTARRPQHKQCRGSELCKRLVPKSWLFVGTLMLTWLQK